MRKQLSLIALIAGGIAACSSNGPLADTIPYGDFGTFNGAKIEVVADGGIAALSSSQRVTYDNKAFVTVQRRICGTSCQAPLDSASGTLDRLDADQLFNIALAKKGTLKDDYGITTNGADMMTYIVRITSDGTTKTIRADDGTMPSDLRQIVTAVRAAVTAARH